MARLMSASLLEAFKQQDTQFSSHGTLEIFVLLGALSRTYRFATASLSIGGVAYLPQMRAAGEINSDLSSEGDEVTVELQNVDTLLGIEFMALQRSLFGAECTLGRYWKELSRGSEWHEILFTGLIVGIDPDEQNLRLTIVSDVYSGVSVGPIRKVRRLCPFRYKGPECGRPITDPPTCDFTLNGAGGCDGRWGATNKFARIGSAPYIDSNLDLKII